MIYVRNLFTQDLRDGKQIAFTTEPSNIFFKFSFSNKDPDRDISFKFKEKDNKSSFFKFNGKVIHTRLYAAGSESRIDGQLKQFLRDDLDADVDDVIVFKAINEKEYEFEFIPKRGILYAHYKAILNSKNHEVVCEDDIEVVGNTTIDVELQLDSAKLDYNKFIDDSKKANYIIDQKIGLRFISSLLTKPFVILTGLAGSGKTKLAQAFAQWICENDTQYAIVPVGQTGQTENLC